MGFHSHILVWLTQKLRPDRVDDVIPAEIPDINIDKDLFEIVRRHMIHGPCGALNPNSSCMTDGKCKKSFPKAFMAETITGNDGYPLYRRRSIADGGQSFIQRMRVPSSGNSLTPGISEREIDNRWVVPFSPLLSKTFKTHINVEVCNSVKAIKYICKYVCKGHDMANFSCVPPLSRDLLIRDS